MLCSTEIRLPLSKVGGGTAFQVMLVKSRGGAWEREKKAWSAIMARVPGPGKQQSHVTGCFNLPHTTATDPNHWPTADFYDFFSQISS